jgi:hypothetical protein
MENMETIGNLEFLVKLASFGAAGISILAVFIIGSKVFNLPNDTSEIKASILRLYIRMCVFMTVVCGVSGIANAYFNRSRIENAYEKYDKLSSSYQDQVKRIEDEKRTLQMNLEMLREQLGPVSQLSPEVSSAINRAEQSAFELHMVPIEVLEQRIQETPHKRIERMK